MTEIKVIQRSIEKNSKSFSWASKLFTKSQRRSIALLYFLCRQLDDIADSKSADSKYILNKFKRLVIEKEKPSNEESIYNNLYYAYRNLDLNREVVIHLIDGLLSDQEEVRLKDEKELINYCYRVAGTVGLLMCPILGCYKKEALKFAVDLGIAMQMTNIARDVFEDSTLNRRYLPGKWVNYITAAEIRAAGNENASINHLKIQKAISQLLSLAQQYYDSGRLGIYYLPIRSKFGIAVASNIYQDIEKQIKNKNFNWGRSRAYTTLVDKIFATLKSVKTIISLEQNAPTHSDSLHYHLKKFRNSW